MSSRSTITFWWWGEDEASGLGDWLAAACAAFEHVRPDVRVETRLLRHDEVLPAFPAAAAAGRAPDLHFFWNGIYLVENVWRGHLAPLDDLIEPEELAAIGGGPQSVVAGKTYRVGWYVISVVWIANTDVLARAGVSRLPESWAELEEVCARVLAKGFLPITAGDREGDLSVWWLTHFLTQELDHGSDVARLVLGELDWREPGYHRHWTLLSRILGAGFVDLETLPLTLWDGLIRFTEGRSAFTLGSGPMFASCRRALGDGVTPFVAPAAGTGRLAGLPIVDTQGIGIASASPRRELAAAFLCFLHDRERREALWEAVKLFPADRRWSGATIGDTDYRRLWRWYAEGPNAPYVPNFVPLDLHYRLAAEIGRLVLAGKLDGPAAGALAWSRSREWAEADPTRAGRYSDWVSEVASTPA